MNVFIVFDIFLSDVSQSSLGYYSKDNTINLTNKLMSISNSHNHVKCKISLTFQALRSSLLNKISTHTDGLENYSGQLTLQFILIILINYLLFIL